MERLNELASLLHGALQATPTAPVASATLPAQPLDLPDRQRALLKLVCHPAEYTYKQIAAIMGCSSSTLRVHRVRIWKRFGIKSKAGMILWAKEHGFG